MQKNRQMESRIVQSGMLGAFLGLILLPCILQARPGMVSVADTTGARSPIYLKVAPTSSKLWGKTPAMAEFSLFYREFGVHFYHPWREARYRVIRQGLMLVDSPSQGAFALSWTPARWREYFKGGMMLFHRPFPIRHGSQINFLLEAGYQYRRLRIAYSHVSNGFGLLGRWNPGVDHLSVVWIF